MRWWNTEYHNISFIIFCVWECVGTFTHSTEFLEPNFKSWTKSGGQTNLKMPKQCSGLRICLFWAFQTNCNSESFYMLQPIWSKTLIHSETVTLWVYHWIIYSTDLFKSTDTFRNETSDCLSEWVVKSLTQPIHSKVLILSSDWLCLKSDTLWIGNF